MMILEGDAACVGMDQCVNGCCLTRTAPTIIVSGPQGIPRYARSRTIIGSSRSLSSYNRPTVFITEPIVTDI